jgi:hypothetical protein
VWGWEWKITFQQFLSHVWNGKEYYDSLDITPTKEEVEEYIDIMCKKDSLFINTPKKSYIPIYTEPTIVKNVDELTLIKKVNKVKTIKINNYGN